MKKAIYNVVENLTFGSTKTTEFKNYKDAVEYQSKVKSRIKAKPDHKKTSEILSVKIRKQFIEI